MFFLQCVDYVFQTKFHKSSLVNTIQNAHVVFVSISCGLGLLYYVNYSYEIVPYMAKLVFLQCSVDLFLTDKPDIFLHHIVAISMSYLNFSYFTNHLLPMQLPFAVLFSSELSSIFLVLTQYCGKNKNWTNINRLCFMSTFFYTRIYLFLKHIIFNPEYATFIRENSSENVALYCNVMIYSFMFLNLYWASILVKMCYKEIRNYFIHHHTFCTSEFLLQYTYFVCPIISLCTYNTSNMIILFDFFGQGILSINSFYYHNIVYERLKKTLTSNEKTNILDKGIYKAYIADIISIQIRVFLVVLVNLLQVDDAMIGIAGLSHIAMFQLIIVYFFYDYILDMKYKKKEILYNGDKHTIDYILHIPIVIVICNGIVHNKDIDATNHLIISSMLLFNNLFVKPFYELNHFFLHIILWYQTYAISRINNSVL